MLKLANSYIATSHLASRASKRTRLQACDGRKPAMRSLWANHHLNNVLVVLVSYISNLLHTIAVFFNLQRMRIISILIIVENVRNSGVVLII